MSEDTEGSRRDFLKTGTRLALYASAVLGAGGLLRYLSHTENGSTPSRIAVGPDVNFPQGSRTIVVTVPALIVRDENGLRAVSLTPASGLYGRGYRRRFDLPLPRIAL
ncbi:MAG: hypothetical protein IPM16_00875 [Chloroflexi bacterium]|nr:hypothetical protein [Chloroflexota bacterium]